MSRVLGKVARPVKLGVAGLAVLAVGTSAWAFTTQASAAEYSTVDATRRTVVAGLELTGTVTTSGRADLTFATSGTVAKVLVSEGDTVAAGDVIARLDRTALARSVTRARAALHEARATLASDLQVQAAGVLASSATSSTTTTAQPGATRSAASTASTASTAMTVSTTTATMTSSMTSSTTATMTSSTTATMTSSTVTAAATSGKQSAAVTKALAAVKAAQQDVLAAQTAASTSLAEAGTALEHQQQVCAEDVTSTGCADALVAVQQAQVTVADAQTALQEAITTLSAALDTGAAAVAADAAANAGKEGSAPDKKPSSGSEDKSPSGSTPNDKKSQQTPGQTPSSPQSPGSSTGADGPQGSTPSQGGGTGGGAGGQKVTAATIASDQAAVDKARAELLDAKSALAAATLRAPVSGTVRVLDVAVGDAVTTTDVAAVVVSDDVTAVDAAADVTEVGALAVDQTVQVTLPGRTDTVAGTVASVAAAPSSGTSSYAVRVLVDEAGSQDAPGAEPGAGSADVPLGATALMTVVTETSQDVVTVPLSALSTASTGTGTLRVLVDGEVESRRVSLGTVGATHVAVTEGLDEGEAVVLADVGGEVEGAAGEVSTSRGGRGGGGFPGGTPGGGGFPGGAGGGRGR